MKRTALFAGILTIALLLSACGGQSAAPAAEPTTEPATEPAATAAPTSTPEAESTPEPTAEPEATELTASLTVTAWNNESTTRLVDGKRNTRCRYEAGESVTAVSEEPVYSIQLVFNEAPGEYQIDIGDRILTGNETEETELYVDFDAPVTSFQITFFQYVEFAELRAFSDGVLPVDAEG